MMIHDNNKLRKEIKTILATALTGVTDRIYYLNFPKPVTYPYVVFELREVRESYGQTAYTLDVDLVSQSVYTSNSMADKVADTFDHDAVSTNDLFFHSYRNRRYAVVEEDKKIERVHLQMDLYYWTKEESK